MACFKYRIMSGKRQLLINWINADNYKDAKDKLEPLKDKLQGDTIKLIEVSSPLLWEC